MAPQKGGQAAKQQGSAGSTGTSTSTLTTSKPGVAKKPVHAGVALGSLGVVAGAGAGATDAAAARPAAVVPAIPLPLMMHHQQRQASGKGKQQPQPQHHRHSHHQQQEPQQRVATAAAATAAAAAAVAPPVPPLVVSSNGHPVASLEAALIDHQTPAPADDPSAAMARHKQRRFKRGEVTVNGSRVEKPGTPAAVTNGLHHNHPNGNHTAGRPSDRQYAYTNGLQDGHDRPQLPAESAAAAPVANGLGKGPNGHRHAPVAFGESLHNPAMSTTSSAHVSAAPSVAGDVEPAAYAHHQGMSLLPLGSFRLSSPARSSLFCFPFHLQSLPSESRRLLPLPPPPPLPGLASTPPCHATAI
jgi:hypothetical protein